MPKPDLDSAYALETVDDNRRLYADWAATYDTEFAEKMDFIAPQTAADAYAAFGGTGPVLDFGCGTGLVGQHLAALGTGPIDGADLSIEMLKQARAKGCYRDLVSGNVLDGYEMSGAPYAGVISSGTFTQGHVGPHALDTLMDLAQPGATFVLTIHRTHFDDAKFADYFHSRSDRIADLNLPTINFYGPNSTGPHAGDQGYLAQFVRR